MKNCYKQVVLKFNTELENGDEYRSAGVIINNNLPIIYNKQKVGKLLEFSISKEKLEIVFSSDLDLFERKLFACPVFINEITYNKRKKTWSDINLREGVPFKRMVGDTYYF